MGNRAVITDGKKEFGIYVHWNGGPESVCAFLTYAKLSGVRSCDFDECYCFARLAQIIGNFFGGTLSLGVGPLKKLDTNNGDNGTYVIDYNFNVVERLFDGGVPFSDVKMKKSDMIDFVKSIHKRMPKSIDDEFDEKLLDNPPFVSVPNLIIEED